MDGGDRVALRADGDVDRLALERELRRTVTHAQMLDEGVRVGDAYGGVIVLEGGDELLIARREAVAGKITHHLQRSAGREHRVERRAQPVDRARPNAGRAHHPFRAEPRAGPCFARRVARLHEESRRDRAASLHHHEHRIWLGHSRQIIKRRSREEADEVLCRFMPADCDQDAVRHRCGKRVAPCWVFGGRNLRLEGGSGQRAQNRGERAAYGREVGHRLWNGCTSCAGRA